MGRKTALVVLCAAVSAAAADVPYDYELRPPEEERYGGAELVRSGGYLSLTAREFPGTVRVLDGEELRRRGYLWLGQVLAEEAHFYVEYVPGREGPTMVPRLRNSTGREVLLLVDGVPLNDVATGWADLKTFPVEAIARVEIISGPASYRFGDRAVAGVVNVETMTGPREAARTLISASDGSFDSERYRFHFGMTARKFDLFASGNRILTVDPNARDRNASANLDARVARRWEERGEVDLAYGHYTAYEHFLHPWTWEEVRLRGDIPRSPGRQENAHDRVRLAGRRRWGAGEWRAYGYYLRTTSWAHDAEQRRLYQTEACEALGGFAYTRPHLARSAFTAEGAGGWREEVIAEERELLFAARILEELRPSEALYVAVGTSYDVMPAVGGAISPRLAATVLLPRGLSAYGSVSGGARLPAAAELGRRTEITRERGYEAGFRFYRRRTVEAGLAYFYCRGNDVYLDDVGTWTEDLTRGGITASAAGALPPWFDWGASYAWTRAEDAAGEEIGFVPGHRAFGKFGYEDGFLKDDLTIRGGVYATYVGARRTVGRVSPESVAEPAPSFKDPYREELPAYWQAGAHLSVAVVSFQIYCNVDNLNRSREYVGRPGYSIPRKWRTYVGFNWTLFD